MTIFVKFIPFWCIMLKLTCVLPSTINSVLSTCAICSRYSDHPQAFKHTILELKTKCVRILNLRDLTNCTNHNSVYVSIKIETLLLFLLCGLLYLFLFCLKVVKIFILTWALCCLTSGY
jgi:hypothetical protein